MNAVNEYTNINKTTLTLISELKEKCKSQSVMKCKIPVKPEIAVTNIICIFEITKYIYNY